MIRIFDLNSNSFTADILGSNTGYNYAGVAHRSFLNPDLFFYTKGLKICRRSISTQAETCVSSSVTNEPALYFEYLVVHPSESEITGGSKKIMMTINGALTKKCEEIFLTYAGIFAPYPYKVDINYLLFRRYNSLQKVNCNFGTEAYENQSSFTIAVGPVYTSNGITKLKNDEYLLVNDGEIFHLKVSTFQVTFWHH